MGFLLSITGTQKAWIAIAVLALLLSMRGLRRAYIWRRRLNDEKRRLDSLACAGCGYDLQGLTMPRCPECGTLRGFTVPMDKLGLSEQELRESLARRQAQLAARRDADAGK